MRKFQIKNFFAYIKYINNNEKNKFNTTINDFNNFKKFLILICFIKR